MKLVFSEKYEIELACLTTIKWNVSYVSHWIQHAQDYASIQSNIVNVTFDLKKGSFASIMGFKTKGDGFFTLVRLLLIFFT